MLLKFGRGNAKLTKHINTFSLPAGLTCPFAGECKSWIEKAETGGYIVKRKVEGLNPGSYSCFAALAEARYKNLRDMVQHNWNLLKECANKEKDTSELIINSIFNNVTENFVRIHVSGDFFNQAYFNAWCNAVKEFPNIVFYAYTKSIPFWVNALRENPNKIPNNFVLTASYGGIYDNLIEENNLKCVKVYYSPEDAQNDGVEIDHTDELAINPDIKRFGLLIHGVQPKSSPAAQAIHKLKRRNIKYSYSLNKLK